MNNLYLFWYSNIVLENMEYDNFGDLLSKYIIEKISKKNVKWILPKKGILSLFQRKHFIAIGSVVRVSNRNSVVWGSGIIHKNEVIAAGEFVAVRGPLTRKRLLDLGHNVPKTYGDPALLISRFFKPKVIKSKKIGILPHYVDYKKVHNELSDNDLFEVVDLMTNDVESVLKKIMTFDLIISSSLHGIIVPNSYQIPVVWMRFSEKLTGDDVKFYDYFESLNIKSIKKLTIEVSILNDINSKEEFKRLYKHNVILPLSEDVQSLNENLLKTCPFNNL